ncbi:MAG: hypothetical protein ACTSP4_08970, partial [Candidatus Hodarchaeales archaeon]
YIDEKGFLWRCKGFLRMLKGLYSRKTNTELIIMSMATITEIQNRLMQIVYSYNESTKDRYDNNSRASELVQRFKSAMNPNILNNPNIQEELVTTLLNLLMIASELGMDLENKALGLIEEMEQPFFVSA